MKSERLQKLEMELEVNESCMAAGLFPPREKDRYLEEIRLIQVKIVEEKERLRFMKENGDAEEYVIPKRNPGRQAYADPHTLPDIDMGDQMTDNSADTDGFEMTDSGSESDDDTESGADEDGTLSEDTENEDAGDGFSDSHRARRLSLMQDDDSW